MLAVNDPSIGKVLQAKGIDNKEHRQIQKSNKEF